MNIKQGLPAGRQGFAQIVVIIAAVAALALAGTAAYLFVTRPTVSPASYSSPTSYVAPTTDNTQAPVPAVKGVGDLNVVAKDLDQTNLDSMNAQLDQNTSDAASF